MNENQPNNPDVIADTDVSEVQATEAQPQATLEMPAGVTAQQAEMPFAFVAGEPLTELPKDLYIPPDALEVFLEAFEGPLDLLLYLIKRQNLDILNIPIADITKQYTSYIDLMDVLQLRRLQEYERFKSAAEDIDMLPRMERDTFQVSAEVVERTVVKQEPQLDLKELLLAFGAVLKRAEMFTHHHIQRETLSVRQRMTNLLSVLDDRDFVEFTSLFSPEEGRPGVIVTLLAILELGKEALLEIVQTNTFGQIYVKRAQMTADEDVVIPDTDYADEQIASDSEE